MSRIHRTVRSCQWASWLLLSFLAGFGASMSGCECQDCDEDGYSVEDGDCNDEDATVNPAAEEYCDGVDNDCDGEVDEGIGSLWYADTDGDGWGDATQTVQGCNQPEGYVSNADDCDDQAADAYPGAEELCDDVDNNCDGRVDEGLTAAWYRDADQDGYGDAGDVVTDCRQPDGYVAVVGDCDDTDPAVNPEAEEVCDGIDNDCDRNVDESLGSPYYVDADGDGYGDSRQSNLFCDGAPEGYSESGDDCDDTDPLIHPGALEVCDGVDNDCSGVADDGIGYEWYVDQDGDGYGDPTGAITACDQPEGYVADSSDCDDTDASIHPGAPEPCDGLDNDCDGEVDGGTEQTWYRDADGDGYGTDTDTVFGCDAPEGYVSEAGDCDDGDSAVNPGVEEACDGLDNDCDGEVDEGLERLTYYPDLDGDGVGAEEGAVEACSRPENYVTTGGDCDDSDAAVHPGADELCNGIDDDCNGTVDDGWVSSTWYADLDGDGWGNPDDTLTGCEQPADHVARDGDCDDTDAQIHPDAEEVCDGADNDCDGEVDEGFVWYLDEDLDGYGLADASINACEPPPSYAAQAGDCDDRDPSVHPGAAEVCGDGIDQDCDGLEDDSATDTWYRDADGDGFGSTDPQDTTCGEQSGFTSSRGDCDDTDPSVHPGADDPTGDGIDSDCGGADGPQPHVGLGTGSLDTIQAAIDAAVDGDIVWIGPGTYQEHDISLLGKAITLISTAGPENTVVDAQGVGRGFLFNTKESADCHLKGFTITGGMATYGGGIRGYKSSPTLEELILTRNSASTSGGGFNFAGGAPTLRDVLVEANDAPTNVGGGGFANSSTSLVLERVVFKNNSSRWGGGGFYGKNITIAFQDVVFEGNESWIDGKDLVFGGGLYLEAVSGEISGGHFEDNLAGRGGAGYLLDTDVRISRTVITGNAAFRGGGLYLERADISLAGASIASNMVMSTCDSVCAESECSDCDYQELDGCLGGDGGGIFLVDAAPVFDNVVVTDNDAADGGGIYARTSSLTLRRTYVYANRATAWCQTGGCLGGHGAGLLATDTTLVLSNVLVAANEATTGVEVQDIRFPDSEGGCSSGTVRSCTGGDGAGIYLADVSGDFVHLAVLGNIAGMDECPGDTFDGAAMFGGVGGIFGLDGTMVNSVVAWNSVVNLSASRTGATVTYSDLYNPEGAPNHDLDPLDATNQTVEPGFLSYDADGVPSDLHLALQSPLVDAGDPAGQDVDGSTADIGIFGGALGGGWDLDWDDIPDYFWPGTIQDAPEGFDMADYDCAPLDPTTAACP